MRKSSAKERLVLPDPKFGDTVVTKFVNNLMLDGKKSIAFNIFYDAIDAVAGKIEEDENALEVISSGSDNIFESFFQLCSN